ncbi:MAG: FkbM family methyltransferase, partial [Candidatus Paceibacteria bacterium]
RLFKTFPALDYKVVVDLGAYKGEFTDAARRVLGAERVVMVEADPESAAALETKYSAEPSCEIVNAAITNRGGPVELRINTHRDSTSILPITEAAERIFERKMTEERTVEVPGLTLDGLFEQCDLTEVALLKVDIQGAERHMIEAGGRALERVQALYIEVCFEEFYEGCSEFQELDLMLQEHGFKLRSFHENRLGSDGCLAYANALYLKLA